MVQNLTFILRRRWPLLVFLPLVVTLLVAVATPTPEGPGEEYQSTAFLAADPDQTTSVFLEQAALDIVQPPNARAAAAALERPEGDASDLVDMLTVRTDPEAFTISIRAVSEDEDEPAEVARAFAVSFAEATNGGVQQERQAAIDQAQGVLEEAQQELQAFNLANPDLGPDVPPNPDVETERQALADARNAAQQELTALQSESVPTEALRLIGVDEVERAPEPKLQLPANRVARAGMAFLVGAIAAIGIAAFLERLNPRIDDAADAERLVGAPVLASVPVIGRRQRSMLQRASLEDFNGPFAESFRSMRSHLDFLTAHEGREVEPRVMMVSAAPAEGKSTSSAFLALAYLETGRDVLVIGGDLRRPTLHRLFGIPRTPGLTSRLLEGPAAPDLADVVVRDPETGALVVPSGPSTSRITGLLNDLHHLGRAAQQGGRPTIIDSPPIVVANDAVDFLPCVDWVVVVVRAGRTTERSVKAAMQQLELNDARVIGCVMVGSLESSDAKRYYYGYYDDTDTLANRSEGPTVKPPRNGHLPLTEKEGDDGDSRRQDEVATEV
ncbi:CpsD/CapB family tyrosine-protein kinase [Iamia majanohamensis]|uniref:CpsD/CapB family tyrosine-protein kinase n=1 Tax=Iamia majanohamensis TaxID=467976 RepID=A0AAE9Y474_9ACTN|nr:CpsD/CapB family tyrosine-protein kinase [Iamia majanohamensis]WCO65862.1 CpsD/CapB family tyrosine-protein kinase [Iamia majanohamensis]